MWELGLYIQTQMRVYEENGSHKITLRKMFPKLNSSRAFKFHALRRGNITGRRIGKLTKEGDLVIMASKGASVVFINIGKSVADVIAAKLVDNKGKQQDVATFYIHPLRFSGR